MPNSAQLEEYYKFLTWFKIHHPELNRDYWQHITIPKPGEGIKVISTDLDAAMLLNLKQIAHDYYHPWRKKIYA